MVGTRVRRALIVGRSAAAMEDYAAALTFGPYDEVLVVGKMLVAFPHEADHAVSFHSDLFAKWARTRRERGYPPVGCYWGATYKGKDMYLGHPAPGPLRRVAQVGGSSGFMAVQVAVDELRCERVVLAGVPMDAAASHMPFTLCSSETSGAPWAEADHYWETWVERMDWLRGYVRSVSGRTRDVLGAPTQEWLV